MPDKCPLFKLTNLDWGALLSASSLVLDYALQILPGILHLVCLILTIIFVVFGIIIRWYDLKERRKGDGYPRVMKKLED